MNPRGFNLFILIQFMCRYFKFSDVCGGGGGGGVGEKECVHGIHNGKTRGIER